MARIFVYDGREHPDPDPTLGVDRVQELFGDFFPEVATADVKTSKRDNGDEVIEFVRRVGSKG